MEKELTKHIVEAVLELNSGLNWWDELKKIKIYIREDDLDTIAFHFKDERAGLRFDYYQSLFDLENMRIDSLQEIWEYRVHEKMLEGKMYFSELDYVEIPKSLTEDKMKEIMSFERLQRR